MTLDGRGEKATTGYARRATATDLEWLGQVHMPHSLGLLYEQRDRATSASCTRRDEYKVMALASFGKPRYLDEFREIVRLGRGRPVHDRSRCGWRSGSARRGSAAAPLEQRHYDIAHSLQVVLEETVLELAQLAARRDRLPTTSAWPAAWR